MALRRRQPTGVWMKITNPGRIISRRKRLGYTQTDLAGLVGCTQQYISMLERGEDTDCSEGLARRIAKRLDIDLEEVFDERGSFSVPGSPRSKVGIKVRAA